MSTLLEVLLTFVGVMFILALAAQSIQELLKAAFVLKGQALLKAIEGLIGEAVSSQGLTKTDASELMKELIRRLRALGQPAWQKKKLRLDSLPADKLNELVASVDPSTVPALQIRQADAKTILAAIGAQAEKWYDLAVTPVADRYKRRMRILALATSAMLVVPLNAGAKKVFDAARTDPTFRQKVIAMVRQIDSIPRDSLQAVAADSVAESAGNPAAKARMETRRSLAQGRVALAGLADSALFHFGLPSHAEVRSFPWYVGIVVSILFVSLGAPFWHDLFEMIFGLKNRAKGTPENEKARG